MHPISSKMGALRTYEGSGVADTMARGGECCCGCVGGMLLACFVGCVRLVTMSTVKTGALDHTVTCICRRKGDGTHEENSIKRDIQNFGNKKKLPIFRVLLFSPLPAPRAPSPFHPPLASLPRLYGASGHHFNVRPLE